MSFSETLGFIGAGNMGMAIIKGVSDTENKIYVYDLDPEKRQQLKALGVTTCEDETEIAKKCKYIVLACKPQQLGDLLTKIAPHINPETVLISICAGISAEFIAKFTGANVKVVLVMPNMPILLGEGATAMSHNAYVTAEEFSFAKAVFESCGIVETVPINKMNEIIAINGSSPAFIYLFAKCFADYAEKQGINSKSALNLFAKTLIGSGKMLLETGETPEELIAKVTSKGGTTLAGLQELRSNNLEEIIEKACTACTKRAYELGQ